MQSDFVSRVAIGTTKLGIPYGAVKPEQVNEAIAEQIFLKARDLGFNCFDTAPSYGTAEQLIGEHLSPELRRRCVTKVAKITADVINDESLQIVENHFQISLQHMQTPTCYGLLVHDVQDLYKPGASKLVKWMRSLKGKGRTNKIGVSVYTPEEAEDLFDRFDFDLIQLPCNIFDQRFIQSGVLDMLVKKGVEIHARSLFLKGLILKSNSNAGLPDALLTHNKIFHESINREGVSAYDACLAFAKKHVAINRWVIGVSTERQLNKICQNSYKQKMAKTTIDFNQWAFTDTMLLDPRQW